MNNTCEHQCTSNCRRVGCNCECGEYHEDVCPDCGGTGEVTTMDRVYLGEPHMAPVGTEKCHCQIRDEEEVCD